MSDGGQTQEARPSLGNLNSAKGIVEARFDAPAYPVIELKTPQPHSRFKYLRDVGYYPYKANYPQVAGMSLHRHPLWERFPQISRDFFGETPVYAGVNPDERNVWKAIGKYDSQPSYAFRDDPLWAVACKLVEEKYHSVFYQPPISFDDALATMDGSKSPGFPWGPMGYRDKATAMTHPEFARIVMEGKTTTIYKVAPKHEWKEIDAIQNLHKIRNFVIEPVHSAVQKKMLYYNQNQAMKQYGWSSYGFNPFQGGFDRMANQLLDCYGIESGDIVGFDRKFAVMPEIYRMRNAGLRKHGLNPQYEILAVKQEKDMVYIYMLLPDGSIVVIQWSNPSGSVNTTPDNILGNILMQTFKLLVASRDAQSVTPRKFLDGNSYFIFGDDYLGGVPEECKLVLDREWSSKFWQNNFGYELKEFQAGTATPTELSKHKFLGGTFKRISSGWIPAFEFERIRDSFCWNIDTLSLEALVNKLYTLCVLSFAHDELFIHTTLSYRKILAFVKESNPLASAALQAAIQRGPPSASAMVAFYLGLESMNLESVPFFHALTEDGRKKFIKFQSSAMNGTSQDKGKGKIPKNNQVDLGAVKALAGRVKRLNQLVGPNATSSGKSVPRTAAASSSKGVQKRVQRSDGGGLTPSAISASSIVRKVPKKKKPLAVVSPDKGVPRPRTMTVQDKEGNRHLIPMAGGNAPAIRTHSYVGPTGKPIATTRIVSNDSEFTTRLSQVKQKGFASKAVGLASSSLYHGSDAIEKDFVKDGVRGTRVAGNQYLDIVQTPTNGVGVGGRLTFILVNPAALGAILSKMSQVYEQVKINHFKVVYKPVVAATEEGALAVYFRNDTSNPVYEVGLDELIAASSHQSFFETSVWESASMEIDPSDMLLKYWDETSGDFADEVQGMITVIATSSFPENEGIGPKTYGHLYLEFDAEFFSPELDYEVNEVGVLDLTFTWSSYTSVLGEPLRMIFRTAFAGTPTAAWQTDPPPSVEYLVYGVVTYIAPGAGVNPVFSTANDTQQHEFVVGQGFYIRLIGLSGNWTNSTIVAYIFADLQSAESTSDDDPADGQLVYSTASVWAAGQVVFRLRSLPLAEGQ